MKWYEKKMAEKSPKAWKRVLEIADSPKENPQDFTRCSGAVLCEICRQSYYDIPGIRITLILQ